jgi:LysR family transcriptional regulator, nitrogen assimilation regulatory protein
MEIRRLEYFVRIADLGSLARAATVLHVAQSALTRQMKLLEEELGVSLFSRSHRGMQLTEEGRHFLSDITGPLRQLDVAVQNARTLSSAISGDMAMGMPPTVAYALAEPLLARIARDEPGIAVRIVEGSSIHLSDWLINGELDMAVIYGPSPSDKLRDRDLLTENLVLVGSASSNLSPDRPIPFEQVTALPLILPSPNNSLRGISERCAAAISSKEMQIKYVIDSFPLVKRMVEKGAGYTILPVSSFVDEFEQGLLKYAPICAPDIRRRLLLAARPYGRIPRVITRVDELVQQVVAELQAQGKIAGARIGARIN